LRALITLAAALAACGPDEPAGLDEGEHLCTRHQEIRPTTDDPYLNFGYEGVEASSYASPGGSFRVWWVEQGRHRVLEGDTSPADGVPDYVQRVAETADAVAAELESSGWRLALDDETFAVPWEVGGDGRFDIYLIDFAGGADGLVARNGCAATPGDPVPRCTTHMLIENDFAGYGYPSIEEAVLVLVSHEYFHAVQAAYVDEIPGWVSEGTATWYQEHYAPTQSDFERLTRTFFQDVARPLNSRNNGPTDGFQYAVAVFFRCLELRYDEELLVRTFGRMTAGVDLLTALDGELAASHASSLEAAFGGFVAWNLFTASRAVDGQGYPNANLFPPAPVAEYDATRGLNWDVNVDHLAAKYAALEVSGPVRLELQALPDRELSAQPRALVLRGPEDYSWVRPGDPLILEEQAAGELRVAVFNVDTVEDASLRLAVRNHTPTVDPDPEPEPGPEPGPSPGEGEGGAGDEGCATGAPGAPAGAPGLAFAMLGVLWARARRR
jgi:hypothetical protein